MDKLDFKTRVDKAYVKFRLEGTPLEEESTANMPELFSTLQKKDPELLAELESMYGFAGKTSVNVFEITGFPNELRNDTKFLEHVSKYIDAVTPGLLQGNLPLGQPLRPNLKEINGLAINFVKKRQDGFLIQFVSAVTDETYDNWEFRTVIRPHFETVIVRFGQPVFIEVRAGFSESKQYLRAIEEVAGVKPHTFTILPLTKVTEPEAVRIAQLLDAGLVEAAHVGTGIYSSKSVAAAEDVEDLRKEEEYQAEFAGQQYLSQTMRVSYTDDRGFSSVISFKIQMKGGFHFLSKVSEPMITFVIKAFYEARRMGTTEVASTDENPSAE